MLPVLLNTLGLDILSSSFNTETPNFLTCQMRVVTRDMSVIGLAQCLSQRAGQTIVLTMALGLIHLTFTMAGGRKVVLGTFDKIRLPKKIEKSRGDCTNVN